jgi:hypothetical protein
MLKEKIYEKGDIVTLYLQTGQEILGKLDEENGSYIVITKPLTIAMGPKGAMFQTFTVTGDSENNVYFKQDKVISMLKTRKETTDAYTQATSTIITPDKGGIVT